MALKYLVWQGEDAGVGIGIGIGIVSTQGSMSITQVNHSISQISPAPRFGKERRA